MFFHIGLINWVTHHTEDSSNSSPRGTLCFFSLGHPAPWTCPESPLPSMSRVRSPQGQPGPKPTSRCPPSRCGLGSGTRLRSSLQGAALSSQAPQDGVRAEPRAPSQPGVHRPAGEPPGCHPQVHLDSSPVLTFTPCWLRELPNILPINTFPASSIRRKSAPPPSARTSRH